MRKKLLLIVILFMFASSAFAAIHVAVLETIASNSDLMTLSERQYLTNILREQAVKALPSDENYIIMTRENINMMLPPGKDIEDCEGSCMAETGRNIAADYAVREMPDDRFLFEVSQHNVPAIAAQNGIFHYSIREGIKIFGFDLRRADLDRITKHITHIHSPLRA